MVCAATSLNKLQLQLKGEKVLQAPNPTPSSLTLTGNKVSGRLHSIPCSSIMQDPVALGPQQLTSSGSEAVLINKMRNLICGKKTLCAD